MQGMVGVAAVEAVETAVNAPTSQLARTVEVSLAWSHSRISR